MAATANIRSAPEDPSHPKPWRGLIDDKTGYIYFWNPETNATQYQKPGTSQMKPDLSDKCATVATCSSVQVQQSSQVRNQEITTTDDNDRNGRGSDGRPKLDCGGRSDQNHKSVTGRMFREGTAVEVSFQKENFNVWHIGTVMKATANDKCLVKYQCPGGVDEHKIQDFAYSPNIRPSPPSLEGSDFCLFDKVEAYFECCWWSGMIKRLLEDRRYIVVIKHAKKEMTFDHANLRPRMVWTDGKWINEAKYNKSPGVLTRQSKNLNSQQNRAEEHQARNGFVSTEKKDNGGVHVEEIVDKECLTKEVDVSVIEVKGARPTVGSDDSRDLPVQNHQCASAEGRYNGFRTPAKVDTMKPSPVRKADGPNPGDLPFKNLDGCAESNDKGCELGTPAIGSTDTMENESLPFVKCSPLWKNIESMELYKTQKPHFSPLVKCREETREGLAVGILVNFFNLVENTSKLQFSSDTSIIERSLENLAEFESHGFNVENVRACLTQLLSKKKRAEELQKEYEDIQSVIYNSLEEVKLDEEINELYEKCKEIERKLAEAKFKKEIRDKTILALQSKRDVVGETVQSLQIEFESIVGSLYGE